jgi:beta-1,4-mannosyltransferase
MEAVAHHPARHAFVDRIWSRRHGSASPSAWDVDELARHGVRVVHLHFGFEQRDAAELQRWVDDLHAAGIGVVHTVHDVDNPHLTDQRDFHDAVDTLVRAADVVTTLTRHAAETIRRRSGTAAAVIPHPHVVPLAQAGSLRAAARCRHGIYVHAATGRPNLDLDAIAGVAQRRGGPPVVVHLRPDAPVATVTALERLARRGRLVLDVRPRLADDELWRRLASSELLLLPYAWGTHSGLLEAAHDVATPVLAPAFGGYGDQGAMTYDTDPAPMVAAAVAHRPVTTVEGRRCDLRAARAAFTAVHRRAMRS